MLLITCLFCGPRDEIEFRSGGESHIARPGPAEGVTDEAWGGYLFERANPIGLHFERWFHHAGCRQWFNLARDTASHEIKAVYPMDAPRPEVGR